MYTTTATRVLKSFGFTPSEWNSVSRALASDRNLRNRVLNQAKLYGLASTIETGSLNVDDGAVPKLQIPVPENEDDLVRFAAVARRVEITPSTRRSLVDVPTGRAEGRTPAPEAARAARQVPQGRRRLPGLPDLRLRVAADDVESSPADLRVVPGASA